MRTIVLLLTPVLALGMVMAAVSDEPSKFNTTKTPTSAAKPDKQTASSEAPQDWIIIGEEVWFSILEEPEESMKEARQSFLMKNMTATAGSLRLAAQYLRTEARNSAPEGQTALVASAKEFDRLADQVQKGTVKSVKTFDAAFARAEYALALNHAKKAASAIANKQTRKAGYYLKSAADHLEGAAAWTGQKLGTGTVAIIDGARLLGGRMIEGTGFVLDEASKGVDVIGLEVERFGRFVKPPASSW